MSVMSPLILVNCMIVHIDCGKRAYKERGQVELTYSVRENLLPGVAWDDKQCGITLIY